MRLCCVSLSGVTVPTSDVNQVVLEIVVSRLGKCGGSTLKKGVGCQRLSDVFSSETGETRGYCYARTRRVNKVMVCQEECNGDKASFDEGLF